MRVTVNDIRVNYEMAGHGSDVILIHGSPDNLTMWQHQFRALSSRYRVTAYDMRGFGQTDFGEAEYTLSTLVNDLIGLIEVLELNRPVIAGYSMGGWVATMFAVTHTEQLRALVLTGCSGGIGKPPADLVADQQHIIELLGRGDITAIAETMTLRCFSPGFREKNPAEFQRYLNIKAANRLEDLARLMGIGRGFPSQLPFQEITCPTLFIAGQHDAVAPVSSQRQAHQLTPGSKFITLPGGHASMLEFPEDFNSAFIEFLDHLK